MYRLLLCAINSHKHMNFHHHLSLSFFHLFQERVFISFNQPELLFFFINILFHMKSRETKV
jgi:hypothetical protein